MGCSVPMGSPPNQRATTAPAIYPSSIMICSFRILRSAAGINPEQAQKIPIRPRNRANLTVPLIRIISGRGVTPCAPVFGLAKHRLAWSDEPCHPLSLHLTAKWLTASTSGKTTATMVGSVTKTRAAIVVARNDTHEFRLSALRINTQTQYTVARSAKPITRIGTNPRQSLVNAGNCLSPIITFVDS